MDANETGQQQMTHFDGCEKYHHACALAQLTALRARLEESEKDAARLDWLDKTGFEWGHGFCHKGYGEYMYYAHSSCGGYTLPTARAAIDSAMGGRDAA